MKIERCHTGRLCYQGTETVEVWKGHRGEENNRHTQNGEEVILRCHFPFALFLPSHLLVS